MAARDHDRRENEGLRTTWLLAQASGLAALAFFALAASGARDPGLAHSDHVLWVLCAECLSGLALTVLAVALGRRALVVDSPRELERTLFGWLAALPALAAGTFVTILLVAGAFSLLGEVSGPLLLVSYLAALFVPGAVTGWVLGTFVAKRAVVHALVLGLLLPPGVYAASRDPELTLFALGCLPGLLAASWVTTRVRGRTGGRPARRRPTAQP